MILRREETLELSTQVQRLVARLMDRDQNVKETFHDLECRINRHRVAIDREETRVQSHLPRVFPIANHLVVEQVVYSIYHMVLYSLPEGDGWFEVVGKWE